MKNIILILILSIGTYSIAQGDKSTCPTNLSIFAEYAKVKNYDSAYAPWKEVINTCPEINVATFKYGELILKHKIKNACKC